MELRKDIFTSKVLWVPEEMDFNKEYNIKPGTAVLIPKEFDWIGILGKMEGITLVTEGQTNGSHILIGRQAKNIKLLGNAVAGLPYGIRLSNPKEFALHCNQYGPDSEVAGVEVDGSYMGMHLGSMPSDVYPPGEIQGINIHHNYFHNTQLEAFYLGQDQLGGIWINAWVHHNKVKNAGNDGIQCRNGYFTIEDNDIDGTGVISGTEMLGHAHGILNGGNTRGCMIRRNKLRNVLGYGVFANGYGEQVISDNDIECGISGVFTKNKEAKSEDLQKAGFQKFVITNNKIVANNGLMIESYYDDNGCPVEVTEYGNTGKGDIVIKPGIVRIGKPDVPPVKEVAEKFYRMVSGKRKYYTLYKDSTWELKK